LLFPLIDDGFRDGGQDDAAGTNDVSTERTLTEQTALPHLLPPGVEGLEQVEIKRVSLSLLARALAPDRVEHLRAVAEQARPLLAGRIVWNINSTAKGGGVAEMLQTLLAYGRGAGVDTRWLVLQGDEEFFAITKRLHNRLHGAVGDGGPLGEHEHRHYRNIQAANLVLIGQVVRVNDIVLLHDPQTAGLVDGLRALGAIVVWRCHVGCDEQNEYARQGWTFLQRYAQHADAFIFSREAYAPQWVHRDALWVIPPSIDPFSGKNREMEPAEVRSILLRTGLLAGVDAAGPLPFIRRNGSHGQVRTHRGLMGNDAALAPSARLVIQVSRWDRLKDMSGVLIGFAGHPTPDDVHLLLVGPDISAVTDDPEGADILQECRSLQDQLPSAIRARVHLVNLPMDDVDENALIVNALQRHASIVVQKSLVEGFGLTVTEALWKSRPMIASAVGGIQDQITNERDGLLIADPRDLDAFAAALQTLLDDPELAARLGAAGRQRVVDEYLGDRHLTQYVDLFGTLIESEPATPSTC
jgi:trehalose synthase